MHIERKLAFLKGCTEQPGSHCSHLSTSNPDLLKSCLYQMNWLNQSLAREAVAFSQLQSEATALPQLPKIHKQGQHAPLEHSTKSLLSKASLLLNTSKPIQNSCLKVTTKHTAKSAQHKQKRVRARVIVRQPFLSKEQRHFQAQAVEVEEKKVKELGLYQSANVFKAKNVAEQLSKLTVVAERPEFNPLKLIKKNEIFLTNIGISNPFNLETFIEDELNRDKQCQQVITFCDSVGAFARPHLEIKSLLQSSPQEVPPTPIYISFKNYTVLQDEQYRLLKVRNLQNWGAVLLNLQQFCSCLRRHKIMHLVVKEDRIRFWEGQKSTPQALEAALAVTNSTHAERVHRVVLAFRDKLKVAVMKRALQRKERLARWVAQRLKTVVSVGKEKQRKRLKAMRLQERLGDQQFQAEIQVRIPSFSAQPFKRITTQYMQSFQALYHALWENTKLPLVLVLPTLNQNLLTLLQNRIKITRPLTIITPELHSLFPNHLPLAAHVLFSYQTLRKIEKAISGKQAVLYGGIFDDPTHQLLLSQHLDAPLYSTLLIKNSVEQQKQLFHRVGLRNPAFCIIEPQSSMEQLLEKLAQLLLQGEEKNWVFKTGGEFRGRGIATLRFNPLKQINKEQPRSSNLLSLKEGLRNMLRLKLKVNFQNSLFMVENYLAHFLQKGGLIQQLIEVHTTYELCFRKEASCQLLSVFKVYGINFANKVWLSATHTPELSGLAARLQSEIESQKYSGYVSVTVCRSANYEFMGVDVKLGQSAPSSVTSFITMVEQKRMTCGSNAINLAELPTKRSEGDPLPSDAKAYPLVSAEPYRYLFVPTFPFTDIHENTKAQLIQQLMTQCWADKRLRVGEEGRLYFSLGLDFSALVVSKELKKLKKMSIELVRELAERMGSLKQYRGKEVVRDVFQYGDVIRSISQIRNDD